VAPRTNLDHMEKRKFLILLGLESRPSVVQPVVICCTDRARSVPSFAHSVTNLVLRAVHNTEPSAFNSRRLQQSFRLGDCSISLVSFW
jgi:hypothetical protein